MATRGCQVHRECSLTRLAACHAGGARCKTSRALDSGHSGECGARCHSSRLCSVRAGCPGNSLLLQLLSADPLAVGTALPLPLCRVRDPQDNGNSWRLSTTAPGVQACEPCVIGVMVELPHHSCSSSLLVQHTSGCPASSQTAPSQVCGRAG
jgi:hypothetical protein